MSKVILFLSCIWLLFAIAHEVLTGEVWFWVLPGMAPPILFAVIPVIFLFSLVFTKKFRLPIVATAVLAFAISVPSTGINFSGYFQRTEIVKSNSASTFSVVQMNTDYWGQLRDGTLTDPRNKNAMLDYLKSLDADVYLLQEHMQRVGELAPPVTDLSDVREKFPEYEAVAAGTLLTLSRLPVVEHNVVNPDSESDLQLPPPPYALKVNVRVANETLSTYNIHMPIQIIIEKNWFNADFYDEIFRRHHIRKDEYQNLLFDVSNNPLPMLMAGDFNTSPAMGDNRDLLGVMVDAASFSSTLYPSTWRVGGQLPRLWRNDWFLVKNNIQVEQFRSLNPEGNSDHLVQKVKLSIGNLATYASR